jgi:hypothetical protein
MDAERESLVVGVFGSQQQADAALEGLHRIGVTDADVDIGPPEPGRYRFEHHEAAEFWTAVRNGMVVGAVIGSAIATGIMWLAVPGLTLAGHIALGVPMGAFWGVFFGGLSGATLKAVTLAEGEPRYAVTDESDDVLMIVHAGDRFGTVHAALESRHPRHFLTDVPAVHHTQPHPAASG